MKKDKKMITIFFRRKPNTRLEQLLIPETSVNAAERRFKKEFPEATIIASEEFILQAKGHAYDEETHQS